MKKDVMIVTGAGQIGMAIARRVGFGKKIILGDKSIKNAEAIAKIMNDAGYDVEPFEMDLSSRESILSIIAKAQEYGQIKYLVNAAGVSPSQAPIEAILKVDLYGTAVLLEEVGKVIAEGGAGVTISSQSGWRMPQLTPEEDRQLATTPTEELLDSESTAAVDIRAVYDDGHLTLRFRDSAMLFDPLLYTQQFVVSDKDPAKNIGLRIVSGLAEDMRYSCVADCNIVLLKIC